MRTDHREYDDVTIVFLFDDRRSQFLIEKQVFSLIVHIIHSLHMEGLWSSGIPELKRFIYILQHYMRFLHAVVCSVGYIALISYHILMRSDMTCLSSFLNGLSLFLLM